MLTQLLIRNYALIKSLDLTPHSGLNVITGETGAGKSIMLGAMGLLMGERADTKALWAEGEKCVAEAHFSTNPADLQEIFENQDLDVEASTVLRREISASGKSRAFINDTPVTLDVLRTISSRLMDIHSQHDTLALAHRGFQLSLIDSFAQNHQLRTRYAEHWAQLVAARQKYKEVTEQAERLKQESDYISFQLDELNKAALAEGEQEQLESDVKVLENAEEIKQRLHQSIALLSHTESSAQNTISEARGILQPLAQFSDMYRQLVHRMESLRIELADIVRELEHAEERVEFDPDKATEAQSRLSTIYQLQKKHRCHSVGDLLQLRDDLQAKANTIKNIDHEIAHAQQQLAACEWRVADSGAKLSQSRLTVFQPLTKKITVLLQELGMPDAQIKIEHEAVTPQASGCDNIDVLFSANKGMAPKPLVQVASGGEFARLMFAVKFVMAERTAMPTLVLDEIDTGVSGEIALRLGKLMQAMAKNHQVIAISHLPQIAARGQAHYLVYKSTEGKKAVSHLRLLTDEERVTEIAKMIGGDKPSASALANARELMA